jgi:translation initiation factor IF-3
VPTAKALELARKQGLNLVEVDSELEPPLCKIVSSQQLRYEILRARARARHERVELEIRENQIKEKE